VPLGGAEKFAFKNQSKLGGAHWQAVIYIGGLE
jgi:hypothetical protein